MPDFNKVFPFNQTNFLGRWSIKVGRSSKFNEQWFVFEWAALITFQAKFLKGISRGAIDFGNKLRARDF